jgi:hypothetical protein
MLDYGAVAVLGALVSLGELVSRYRDSPRLSLLGSFAAWLYCILNAVVSISALRLMNVFNLTFGQTGDALHCMRILAAGVSAIAFFRTSLFTVRVGDQDLGVGPVSFLQVILGAVDREVDRRRASGRAQEVGPLVAGLSYDKASVALPAYCLALMQNLSDEDQKRLGEAVVSLREMQIPENVKLRILAAYLMNAVGPEALKQAVFSLADDLKPDSRVGIQPTANQPASASSLERSSSAHTSSS